MIGLFDVAAPERVNLRIDIDNDPHQSDEDDRSPEPPPPLRPSLEDYSGIGAVSSMHKISTKDAKNLLIYDVAFKLKHSEIYDIGGTYMEEVSESDNRSLEIIPELWFFYSTSPCPGNNFLLNLFVCHRKTGNFSVGVSNKNDLTHKKKANEKLGQSSLPESLTWNLFRSSKLHENYYLKTYCFSDKDLKALEFNTLVIPVRIEMNTVHTMNNDVIKKIKLNHDFADVLTKQEKTDFTLISVTQKQYPVHKIFLAAHSPVIRDIIKNKTADNAQAFIDISDNDMELLLEFIYTGTIKEILNRDCLKLLQIAGKFKLINLFNLTQFALSEQINVENAVDIACTAEKYKLEKLQTIVFVFIKNNPKVLETDGWKNLDDVNLAKKLFQFMHTKND